MTDSLPAVVEVLVNTCYGGFSISPQAMALYHERCVTRGLEPLPSPYGLESHRTDPLLLEIVRELGAEANGKHARLWIYQGIAGHYGISEYDGLESFDPCISSKPKLDLRALVFEPLPSPEEKIRRLQEAYLELDRIHALAAHLPHEPVYQTVKPTSILDPLS